MILPSHPHPMPRNALFIGISSGEGTRSATLTISHHLSPSFYTIGKLMPFIF